MKTTFGNLIVTIALLSAHTNATAGALLFTEEMNLHTMMEATTSVFTNLVDIGNGSIGAPITWSGSFSPTGWTYSGTGVFGGEALNLTYSGALSGNDGQDITVSFTGSGSLGAQPLLMTGQTTWHYDVLENDYVDVDFEQLTKVGAHSFWGWVLGAEIVVGVGAGIAVGVGVGTVIPPGGAVAGLKAGTVATGALVTISAGAKTLLTESSTPPAKPTKPTKLPTPVAGNFYPNDGTIVTLVADAGNLAANDLTGRYTSLGTFDGGVFSGITFVPEPASLALCLIGLSALRIRSRQDVKQWRFPL